MSPLRIKTGNAEQITDSAGGITLSVPIEFKRRNGRCLVTLPDGKVRGFERPWDLAATPEQLALARGMVWRCMLESGEAQSMREIARLEGVDGSYVARLVGLTLVSPTEVAAVLALKFTP